jgi:hypothetical protein
MRSNQTLVASGVQRWMVEQINAHLLPLKLLDLVHRCKKNMAFDSSQLHCLKTNFYQSACGPIFKQCKPKNAHTTSDMRQQSMPSPNIFIFKPINIL